MRNSEKTCAAYARLNALVSAIIIAIVTIVLFPTFYLIGIGWSVGALVAFADDLSR